ncbi:MAG: hypothetical protein PHQ83_05010 [Eubacteriales bacterium]|nr:hypothetical protein [Eubacteriales bacterium]
MKPGIGSKLWLFTAAYFILVFVNIHLALLAIICFTLPVYFLLRDQKKSWCQSYCPRASFLMKVPRSKNQPLRPIPAWLISEKTRQWVVRYFAMNLFFATMSTLMVVVGRMAPMLIPRFLILFPVNVNLPQLISLDLPLWLTHLSFRFLSMMMTSTLVGVALAILYRNRTWCAICPVATLSDQYLEQSSSESP